MHNKPTNPLCNCPDCRVEDNTPSPDNWREESLKQASADKLAEFTNRQVFSDLMVEEVSNLIKFAFEAGFNNPACNSKQVALKLCNTPIFIDNSAISMILWAFTSGQDHCYYRNWASQFDKDSKVFSPLCKRWEFIELTKGTKTLQEIIDSYQPQPKPSGADILDKLYGLMGDKM